MKWLLNVFLDMAIFEQVLMLLCFGAMFVIVFVSLVMEVYKGFRKEGK